MHWLQVRGEGTTSGATVAAGRCCADLETSSSGAIPFCCRDLYSSGLLIPACCTTPASDSHLVCL